MLEAVEIACTRGRKLLFEDVSFVSSGGEAFRVCGGNGAGKTSLLRILTGLSRPDRGLVLWESEPIAKEIDNFRSRLIYIGHSESLKPELTLYENLVFLLTLSNISVSSERLLSDMENWGLGAVAHNLVSTLSKGQKRLGSLVRLLYCKAKRLWILDEPFSGLDQSATSRLICLLDNHLASQGVLVYTTHENIGLKSPGRHISLEKM